ncbi:MAG: hypothetical protein NTW74_16510 [Acidobacteria bacterium]|nr:hypothetical protein [Acidobacteriota bacterium]
MGGLFGVVFNGTKVYNLYEKNTSRPDFAADAMGWSRGLGSAPGEVSFSVFVAGAVRHAELTSRPNVDAAV